MKNIHDILLAVALLALSICQTNAQGWERTYLLSNNQYFGQVIERADGGFTAMSYLPTTFGNGPADAIVATDEVGNVIWSNAPSPGIAGQQIHQTADGGYYVVGAELVDFAFNSRLGLFRADADGELLWEQLHLINADYFSHWPSASLLLPNGEMLVTGTLNPSSTENDRTYLFKADSEGNEIWAQQYQQPNYLDRYTSIFMADNGDYLLAGHRSWTNGQPMQFVLIRTDPEGNLLAATTWSEIKVQAVTDQLTDGSLLFTTTDSISTNNFPLLLSKTDQSGNLIWEKTIALNDIGLTADEPYSYPNVIAATSDGGAVLIFRKQFTSSIVK